jgi:hypothetical protein
VAILFCLGFAGFAPYILREYLNVPYGSAILLLFLFSLTSLVLLLFIDKKNIGWLVKTIRRYKPRRLKLGSLAVTLFFASLFIRGLLLPVNGWDAYTLYDFRGKAFADGVSQSEFLEIGKYDTYNTALYYFSYPPMTSVLHALIYTSGINRPMVIYALFYIALASLIIVFLSDLRIGGRFKAGFFVISALAPLIFEQTSVAYTNLPFIAFQLGALFLILDYASSKNAYKLILSSIFLAFSAWTRLLEPLYLVILACAIYLIFKNNRINIKQKLFQAFLYLFISLAPRFIWLGYLKSVAGNTAGFTISFSGIIPRLLNTLYLANIVDIFFFIYIALFPLRLYIMLFLIVAASFLFRRKLLSRRTVILVYYCFGVFAIMLGGTLYFSVVYKWWNTIPGSFMRSSLVLIPVIVLSAASFFEDWSKRSSGKK